MQSRAEFITDLNAQSQHNACCTCSRRQFVATSLVVTVGTFLAACGDGVIGSGNRTDIFTGPLNVTVKLADYSALSTVGGIVRLNGTSKPIAVVRTTADTYLAFSMICPHQGTTININGNGFKCPNHGAQFNAQGKWIQSTQVTGNLTQLAVVLDSTAGTLTIT